MSPRTKEQFETIRRTSRKSILDAALKLFASKGYHNSSISAIASSAGVSKGLLYNYFEGKKELLYAIMEETFSIWESMMKDPEMEQLDGYDKLAFIIDRTFAMVEGNKDYYRLLTSLATQLEVLDELKIKMEEFHQRQIGTFVTLMDEIGAPDPMKETLLLAATLDGIFLHYMATGEDEYPLTEMRDFLKDRFKRMNETVRK